MGKEKQVNSFEKPIDWDTFHDRDKINDDLFKYKSIVFKQDKIEELKKSSNDFLKEYMDSRLFLEHQFLGIPCIKNPFDLMLFQEIIYKLMPDNIIETGGGFCGSAFFYAMVMELLGLPGKVYTSDRIKYNLHPTISTDQKKTLMKSRIVYYQGSQSIDYELINMLSENVMGKDNLVFLDSDHQESYTLVEMMIYEKFIRPGGYMIVEDTCLSGHPCTDKYPDKWGGPWEAIEKFLCLPEQKGRWVQDRSCEKYFLTGNVGGFLRKIK